MGEPALKTPRLVGRSGNLSGKLSGKLTRGLASLLARTGPSADGAPSRHSYMEVPVDQVRRNSYQPRGDFDRGKLERLAASLKESGLLQPVVVRRSGTGFELIAGERRLRAAKLAGFVTLPAIVRDVSEDEMLELALVENVQREDLNPLELARAYRLMVTKFGMTQEEVAGRLSVSRPAVANTLRLLELPDTIREMLGAGQITAGHARAILAAEGEEARLALAREILAKGLSVREAESRAGTGDPVAPKGGARKKDSPPAHIRSLQTKLEERLGTRVHIIEGKRKGKIVIEFYSNDDFERILEVIGAAA